MKRIFVSLALLSTLLLGVAFALGYSIGDPKVREPSVQAAVSNHFLTALAGLAFAALVHALVLTYFMGTGRWMEETMRAYRLPDRWWSESRKLKYQTVPAMVACLLLLVFTGAVGAAADPASPVNFQGWGGLSAAKIHLLIAATMLGVNTLVNLWEYQAIARNVVLINEVLGEVRRIREERGLPVE